MNEKPYNQGIFSKLRDSYERTTIANSFSNNENSNNDKNIDSEINFNLDDSCEYKFESSNLSNLEFNQKKLNDKNKSEIKSNEEFIDSNKNKLDINDKIKVDENGNLNSSKIETEIKNINSSNNKRTFLKNSFNDNKDNKLIVCRPIIIKIHNSSNVSYYLEDSNYLVFLIKSEINTFENIDSDKFYNSSNIYDKYPIKLYFIKNREEDLKVSEIFDSIEDLNNCIQYNEFNEKNEVNYFSIDNLNDYYVELIRNKTNLHHGQQKKIQNKLKNIFSYNSNILTTINECFKESFIDIEINISSNEKIYIYLINPTYNKESQYNSILEINSLHENLIPNKNFEKLINYKNNNNYENIDDKSKNFIDFYGYLKYNVYFSKESIINYLNRYLVNIIHSYTKLSLQFMNLIRRVGFFNEDDINRHLELNTNEEHIDKVEFIFRDCVKDKYLLVYNDLVNKIIEKIENNKIESFHKFIKSNKSFELINSCLSKYNKNLNNLDYNENFKETFTDIFEESDFKEWNEKNQHIIKTDFRESSFKIEHSIDDFKVMKNLIETLIKNIVDKTEVNEKSISKLSERSNKSSKSRSDNSYNSKNNDFVTNFELCRDFLKECFSNSILRDITFKGILNVDLILSDDGLNENCESCSKKGRREKSFYQMAVKMFVNLINKLFKLNDGFIHKHISIMGYSYNFNNNNVVNMINTELDVSTKNRIRLFDIYFDTKWSYKLADLILQIIKALYIDNKSNDRKESNESNENKNIIEFDFSKILNEIFMISENIYEVYCNSLPDYQTYCFKTTDFITEEYNQIDNMCQHFTNKSIEVLLRKNICHYTNLNEVFNKYKLTQMKNDEHLKFDKLPKFNCILNPIVLHIDDGLRDYLINDFIYECKNNNPKDEILSIINELDNINSNKYHWNIIKSNKNNNINQNFNQQNQNQYIEAKLTIPMNIDNTKENNNDQYYQLFNLVNKYHYHLSYLKIQFLECIFKTIRLDDYNNLKNNEIDFDEKSKVNILEDVNKLNLDVKKNKRYYSISTYKNYKLMLTLENKIKNLCLNYHNYFTDCSMFITSIVKNELRKTKSISLNKQTMISKNNISSDENLIHYNNKNENDNLEQFIDHNLEKKHSNYQDNYNDLLNYNKEKINEFENEIDSDVYMRIGWLCFNLKTKDT